MPITTTSLPASRPRGHGARLHRRRDRGGCPRAKTTPCRHPVRADGPRTRGALTGRDHRRSRRRPKRPQAGMHTATPHRRRLHPPRTTRRRIGPTTRVHIRRRHALGVLSTRQGATFPPRLHRSSGALASSTRLTPTTRRLPPLRTVPGMVSTLPTSQAGGLRRAVRRDVVRWRRQLKQTPARSGGRSSRMCNAGKSTRFPRRRFRPPTWTQGRTPPTGATAPSTPPTGGSTRAEGAPVLAAGRRSDELERASAPPCFAGGEDESTRGEAAPTPAASWRSASVHGRAPAPPYATTGATTGGEGGVPLRSTSQYERGEISSSSSE
jgi:hypothetical protein